MASESRRAGRDRPWATTVSAAGSVLVVVAVAWLILGSFRSLRESRGWVGHTHEVIEALDEVVIEVQTVAWRYRTAIVAGDTASLPPEVSPFATDARVEHLAALVSDNAEQERMTPLLSRLAHRAIALNDAAVKLAHHGQLAEATRLVRSDSSRRLADSVAT